MALFVLGDTHLSLGASKPMDIFPGWNDYCIGGRYQLGHAPDRYP